MTKKIPPTCKVCNKHTYGECARVDCGKRKPITAQPPDTVGGIRLPASGAKVPKTRSS